MGETQKNLALYRVYRSKTLDEIVGQGHITDTLAKAIKANQIAHAYLFTGPRGVGKTSVARILAHQINKLDYNGVTNHLDIIEIDAASNRGIDEIRDLREKAFISPTSAKYKVYIIDEVHMLTTPAFNALLKILEEPPSHVVFMLATTEAHKIPETITSRTQRYSFQPLSESDIAKQLSLIAKSEKITITQEGKATIAKHARGSMRDAISLFDQIRAHGANQIDITVVANVLGLVPIELVRDILTTLNLGKTDEMINKLQIAYTQAFSPAQLAQQLTDALREQPIYNLDNVGLLEDLLLVSPAYDPLVKLETVLIRHSLEKNTVTDTQKTPESELEKTDQYNVQPEIVIDNQVKSSQTDVSQFGVSDTARLSDEHLKGLLDGVKNHNKSLYSVLRLAKPYLKDKQLNLEFNFPFHKQRADENRNKRLIEQIASEVLNQDIIVRTIIVPSGPTSDTPKNRDDFSDVINVMGGGSPVEYTDG